MSYFITGTDTDSGKTLVGSALLYAARQKGSTLGVKPIASGCVPTDDGLRNADALALMAQSSVKLDYQAINPFAFEPAIAPHIAARQVGVTLTSTDIKTHLDCLPLDEADFALIEGAGGWRLPLNDELLLDGQVNPDAFLSSVVVEMQLPVILVVGVKLGCLNHALLTQEALLADGVKIAAWIANCVDEKMQVTGDNLAALETLMLAPCLGVIPHLSKADAESAAQYLDLGRLESRFSD